MDNKASTQQYFDRVAKSYLDRYYTDREGRYPNLQLREEIILQAVADLVAPGAFILDAGCGSGHLLSKLAGMGYRLQGMDIAPNMVETSRTLVAALPPAQAARCQVREGDIEALPFADAAFDAAVISGVFEYLTEDAPALAQISRVLKPGGLALVSFRNQGFNAYSANRYTLEEAQTGGMRELVEGFQAALAADAARIKSRVENFRQSLHRTLATPPSSRAEEADQAKGWEKAMQRRQHTPDQVARAAQAAGLDQEQAFFFHFHPFPPQVRDLMPDLYDALGLALENFSDTALGRLMASGFVALLRKS
jgi:ubiquinone/menaquinone biosynthesis C-methylase UbiE